MNFIVQKIKYLLSLIQRLKSLKYNKYTSEMYIVWNTKRNHYIEISIGRRIRI